MSVETRPVELQRGDSVVPGLELVDRRRVDGPADGPQQERTIVVINGDEDKQPVDENGLCEVDIAQDRIDDAAQPQLVQDILGGKLGGGAGA
ncbi:hypothetical protein NDI56_04085 [Haloarcula sp. S1CR25-12]|uniref:Uncharacterized protein n=1 Tax=Haloarcula saliterrae TaxID=2950534 RepID=A0ABU2FA45_9EURY|nr:hypothetical protein [Haloarcula sp. S1CR25-12]MDS0258590.1 hypothetical protein [Haloarcula sp. S1CR25-12]